MAKYFGMKLGLNRTAYDRGQKAVLAKRAFAMEQLEPTFPLFKRNKERNTRQVTAYKDKIGAAIACVAILEHNKSQNDQVGLFKLPKNVARTRIASFAPIKLLDATMEACKIWEPELNFDYTGFFMDCRELLNTVACACFQYFQRNPPSSAPCWSEGLADMVYAVLLDAADGEIDEQHRSKSRALCIANRLLTDHIELHGTEFREAAIERSRGTHKSIDAGPTPRRNPNMFPISG